MFFATILACVVFISTTASADLKKDSPGASKEVPQKLQKVFPVFVTNGSEYVNIVYKTELPSSKTLKVMDIAYRKIQQICGKDICPSQEVRRQMIIALVEDLKKENLAPHEVVFDRMPLLQKVFKKNN